MEVRKVKMLILARTFNQNGGSEGEDVEQRGLPKAGIFPTAPRPAKGASQRFQRLERNASGFFRSPRTAPAAMTSEAAGNHLDRKSYQNLWVFRITAPRPAKGAAQPKSPACQAHRAALASGHSSIRKIEVRGSNLLILA